MSLESTMKANHTIYDFDGIAEELSIYPPPEDRSFIRHFIVRFNKDTLFLDTCVKIHSNDICLIYLGKGHSIVNGNKKIAKIDFKVGNQDRLQNTVKGKFKKLCQSFTPSSIICFIETEDAVRYPVYAGMHGKLLEINDKIIEDPNLIKLNYLAVLILSKDRKIEGLTTDEYLEDLKNRDQFKTN